MRRFYSRKRLRWATHDYARDGYYFVTVVTRNRRPLFGSIERGRVALTREGQIVDHLLAEVESRFTTASADTFVVMPDHIHAVIVLADDGRAPPVSVSAVVRWIKACSTYRIHRLPDRRHVGPVWQASFHDAVIRSARVLAAVRRYIALNPVRGGGSR